MYIIPVILVIAGSFFYILLHKKNFIVFIATCIISILLTSIIVVIDYHSQTTATEVWSGKITNVKHVEEYEEWHEPEYEDVEVKDSKGKVVSTTRVLVRDGYWEHHYATNSIKTSDNGWINVSQNPDGDIKFNDNYPNTDEELEKYWKIGLPSASSHTYENKVQASYSIYRHKDINVKDYPGLPEYPKSINNYINIDRIIGDIPNKDESLKKLAEWNTELNKDIPDPDKPGKTRSYKQVNVIFVNLGDVSEDYGFALQDYWQGGNKNDFVIAFGSDNKNNVTWVYPFSWSEVEILKINIRDYMLDIKSINDFPKIIDDVNSMIEKDFVRKQFADFSYLSIEVKTWAIVLIWILNVIIFFGGFAFVTEEYNGKNY